VEKQGPQGSGRRATATMHECQFACMMLYMPGAPGGPGHSREGRRRNNTIHRSAIDVRTSSVHEVVFALLSLSVRPLLRCRCPSSCLSCLFALALLGLFPQKTQNKTCSQRLLLCAILLLPKACSPVINPKSPSCLSSESS
jgi:hypothetical protein